MNRQDYLSDLVADIENVWLDYVNPNEMDADEIRETLYDELFVDDSVTGNASGSYTFSRSLAKGNVLDALDVLKEACEEFGCMNQLGQRFVNEDFEWMDVTIRCYLLGEAISIFLEQQGLED